MKLADQIQKIPSRTRVIVFFSLVAGLIVLFIWQVHIPKNTQIRQLEQDIAGLQATIRQNDEKIRRLDELRAEVKALNEKLKLLTEQLPPETEVSGLLRQVQNLVNQSGLSLKLWRPGGRRTHASGLYVEIPISLNMAGGYHNFGVFFDRVSKLTRIVNIFDITMGQATLKQAGVVNVNVSCTAMTFAAVEKKGEATPAPKKTR